MTVKAIKEAAKRAVQEDHYWDLLRSIEWMMEYELITYKEYKRLDEELLNARRAKEAREEECEGKEDHEALL